MKTLSLLFSILCASATSQAGVTLNGNVHLSGKVIFSAPIATTGWPVDMFVSFESGTAGDVISTNALIPSTFGYTNGTWSFLRTNTVMALSNTFVDSVNLPLPSPYSINGTMYDGSGTRSLLFTLTNSPYEMVQRTPPTGTFITNVTASGMILYQGQSGSHQDVCVIQSGVNWATFQAENVAGSSPFFRAHGNKSHVSTFGREIPMDTNTMYFWSLRPNVPLGECELCILTTNGVLVGSSIANTDWEYCYYVRLQSYLDKTGGNYWVDNVALAFSNNATLPLQPLTVPAPTNITVLQIATNEAFVTWSPFICCRYQLERSDDDGATWDSIDTNIESDSFIDTNLVAGNTYIFRVKGQVGDNISVATNSEDLEMVTPYHPPAPDLLWAKTDEGTGATAADSSGNSRDLSINSNAVWTNGPIDGTWALVGDGTNTVATNSVSWSAGTNIVTVSYWINSPARSTTSAQFYDIALGIPTGSIREFSAYTSFNSYNVKILSGFATYTSTPSSPSLNNWHDILIVFNNSPDAPSITTYIDGVFNKTTSIASAGGNYSTDKIAIGGLPSNSGASKTIYGDVRIWSGDMSKYAPAFFNDYQ